MSETEKVLYVTDLDGTILRDDGRLSDYTRDTLNDLIANGLRLTAATGRTFSSTRWALAGVNLREPVVCNNGVFVIDYPTGHILYKAILEGAEKEKMLDFLCSRQIPVLVFAMIEGREYVSWMRGWETDSVRRFIADREGSGLHLRPVDNREELGAGEVAQFGIITTKEEAYALRDLCAAHLCAAQGTEYVLYLMDDNRHKMDWWLEIYRPGLDKGTGVAQVKELLGVDKIVAFGDNLNDLPLFAAADECYAVANAKEELKAVATGVIGSNEEDGVARWLTEHGKFLATPRTS